METNDILSIICFSIPVLIFIGIIMLVIAFFIIRNIIRRTRRKIGIPKGTGLAIRQQLANFDQYIQNDERQTRQWTSSASPINQPRLDLDSIELDEVIPETEESPSKPKVAMPNWVDESPSLTCEACGAPQQLQDRVCPFCGHTH